METVGEGFASPEEAVLRDGGFRAVIDEVSGTILYYTDQKGIFIEENDGEIVVEDIRYMDDGDDGGAFVCVSDCLANAALAAVAWKQTGEIFPLPARRDAMKALLAEGLPSGGTDA